MVKSPSSTYSLTVTKNRVKIKYTKINKINIIFPSVKDKSFNQLLNSFIKTL